MKTIYALVDPRTEEVRYVGQSTNPFRRLREHFAAAMLNLDEPKDVWLYDMIIEQKITPELHILEFAEDFKEPERRWVLHYRSQGHRLFNRTHGGDHHCRSQEWRDKTSKRMTGFRHSEESKAKMSASHKGMKWTPEMRAKQEARTVSPETRAKLSEATRRAWAEGRRV